MAGTALGTHLDMSRAVSSLSPVACARENVMFESSLDATCQTPTNFSSFVRRHGRDVTDHFQTLETNISWLLSWDRRDECGREAH